MDKRLSFARLIWKKSLSSIFNKFVAIINSGMVMALGIIIISLGFNFVKFNDIKLEQKSYYNEITFIRQNKVIDAIIEVIDKTSYLDKRIVYASDLQVAEISSEVIEEMNFKVNYFETKNNEFLLENEVISGFEVIGESVLKDAEAIVTYSFAKITASLMNIDYMNLIGKNIKVNDGQSLKLVGIISENSSNLMSYFDEPSVFIKYDFKLNQSVILNATYSYTDFSDIVKIYNNWCDADITMFHYIDQVKKMTTYTTIFTIAFIVLGIITIIVSFGIISSSTNLIYIEFLPFMAMLKIIGINDTKISRFSNMQTFIIAFISFLLSVPLAIFFNFILNLFVDDNILFGDIDFKIISINGRGILFCLLLMIIYIMIAAFFQLRQIKNIDVSEKFLFELEG